MLSELPGRQGKKGNGPLPSSFLERSKKALVLLGSQIFLTLSLAEASQVLLCRVSVLGFSSATVHMLDRPLPGRPQLQHP